MMLELIAISPEDGWAIFTDKNGVFMVRPPYTSSHKAALKQSEVGRLIGEGGFVKPTNSESNFRSIANLISYLEKKIILAREESGNPLPDEGLGENLLSFATIKQLHQFIDKVERELISSGRPTEAYRALTVCLKLPQINEAPDVYSKILHLLERISPAKRNSLVQDAININAYFPRSVIKYGLENLRKFDADLRRRRTFFNFGAQS